MQTRLRLGTRGSKLALTQCEMVVAALARAQGWNAEDAARQIEVVAIKTSGDLIQDRPLADAGGKGLFAKELEEALLAGRIDAAVHSLKDLPGSLSPSFVLACHLPREDPRDALVAGKVRTLDELPKGATVGTSSVRRKAMLLNVRRDLDVVLLRGNVDTRLERVASGAVDATVLALAGLKRLNAEGRATQVFSPREMLPAVAQGAIGVEILSLNKEARDRFAVIDHPETAVAVTLERAFLATLDGSCRTPIAGLAEWRGPKTLEFRGCVLTRDGRTRFDVARSVAPSTAAEAEAAGVDAGRELAATAGRNLFDA